MAKWMISRTQNIKYNTLILGCGSFCFLMAFAIQKVYR